VGWISPLVVLGRVRLSLSFSLSRVLGSTFVPEIDARIEGSAIVIVMYQKLFLHMCVYVDVDEEPASF